MTRDEHLAWAKTRARKHLNRAEASKAIASFLVDLTNQEVWTTLPGVELRAALMRSFFADPSAFNARRLIDQFGELNETRLPADNCPWCGYLLDAASPLGGKATPKPGDISLCLGCGSPLQFGADMRVEKISDQAVREGLSAKAYHVLMQARRLLLSIDRSQLPSQRGRK